MKFEVPARLKPAVDFAVQTLVGCVVFALVYAFSIGLSSFVRLFDAFAPSWMQTAANFGEMLLFGADAACFVLFIVSEVTKFYRSVWRDIWQ